MNEDTQDHEVNTPGEPAQEQAAADADYERAAFQELGEETGGARKGETSLDVILDIPVTLSMEIGRSKISIQNLLQLARGSVVELDRMAGEPLDVLVNGTLVAHGEVVVVNDKFGVRLSDVVSPAERVDTLK
jgi:flagellar motor switch protein FliN/FliY